MTGMVLTTWQNMPPPRNIIGITILEVLPSPVVCINNTARLRNLLQSLIENFNSKLLDIILNIFDK